MVGFISPTGIHHRKKNDISRNYYFLVHLVKTIINHNPNVSLVFILPHSLQSLWNGVLKNILSLLEGNRMNTSFFLTTNDLFLHLSSKTMGLYLDFIPQFLEV